MSDVNLPSDKKLLKQVKKDPEGFGKPMQLVAVQPPFRCAAAAGGL